MALMQSFIIPLIQITFYIGFFGGLTFIVVRAVWIKYSRSWNFFIKYSLFRKKYDTEDVKWCINAIETNMDQYKVKKFLLLNNIEDYRINEIIWIFNKISKELQKGGTYINGREFKGFNSKIEATKIPNSNNKTNSY